MQDKRLIALCFGLVALATSLKGWGSVDLYELTIALYLGAVLYFQQCVPRLLAVSQALLAATIMLLPQYSHLSAILAIISLCSCRKEAVIAPSIIFLAASLWMYDTTSRHTTPLSILLLGLVVVGIGVCTRWQKGLFYGALILWLPTPLIEFTRISGEKTITVESYKKEGVPVFPHGDVICRLIGAQKRGHGEADGQIGIANLIFGDTTIKAEKKIFLVEHGVTPSDRHQGLGKHELLQKKPWEFNQFFGEEHILASVAQDGYWASNLGGSLEPKNTGRVVLASTMHSGGRSFEPIVYDDGEKRYVQDSDPFVDWLAHGQRHVTKEIATGQTSLRALNLFIAILCLVVVVADRKAVSLTMSIVTMLVLWGHWIHDNGNQPQGEVLIVGKVGSPHELSKSAGVMRSLIESGHAFTETSRSPKIVVISEGKSYKLQGSERLVLAGPKCEVITKRGTFEVGDIPQGVVDEIVDSRLIKSPSGEVQTTYKLDDVVIFGTNSPAKQNWNKWLSF
jgi:hypothetical protein